MTARRNVVTKFLVFVFVCLLSGQLSANVQDQSPRIDPRCAELLDSLGSSVPGKVSLTIRPAALARINALRSELKQGNAVGAVVYAFVSTNEGVSVIRFESGPSSGQVIEEVVKKNGMKDDFFRKAVAAARQEDNAFFRNLLRNDFNLIQGGRDRGKQVFIMDTEAFGLVPQSFDLPDSVVLASASLDRAIGNLSSLVRPTPPTVNYAALFGLPNTESEYKNIFRGSTEFAPLAEWQPHWKEQQTLISQYQLKRLSGHGATVSDRKEEVLRQLENQDGVIMIIAHADGAQIRLSDGGMIDLTPDDISKLHFKKNVFVFLRVCQGKDVGFADAFLRAGTAGVWANRGPIEARVANRQAEQFLQSLRAGKSVLDAIREITKTDSHARNGAVLFTKTITQDPGER